MVAIARQAMSVDARFDLGAPPPPPDEARAATLRVQDANRRVLVDRDAPTTLTAIADEFRSTNAEALAHAIAVARVDDARGVGAAGPATISGNIPVAVPVTNTEMGSLDAVMTRDPAGFGGIVDEGGSTMPRAAMIGQPSTTHGGGSWGEAGVRMPPHGVPDYPTRNHGLGTGMVIGGPGFDSNGGSAGTWDDMKEANKSTLENSIAAARRSKETLARASRKVYLDALVQRAGGLDGVTLDGNRGAGDGGVDEMLPRRLLRSSAASAAEGSGGAPGCHASCRPPTETCEVAVHVDGWEGVPAGAREKYKSLVVHALDLRTFDDFCQMKTIAAFEARMEEALAAPPTDETRVMLKLPRDRVGELWARGRERLIELNEEYQRAQRETFDRAVTISAEVNGRTAAVKPGATASARIDNLLGGTGVLHNNPVPEVRRFESALEPAAAAAAEWEEAATRGEHAAEARRQLLDNVNFANEYARKRLAQEAALPDPERMLARNYLERLDPADAANNWAHDHARRVLAQYHAGPPTENAGWSARCAGLVREAWKATGLAEHGGKFLALVVVVFVVSWYGLVSP